MRKDDYQQIKVDKQVRIIDVVEYLDAPQHDIELMRKGLNKLNYSELASLYNGVRRLVTAVEAIEDMK